MRGYNPLYFLGQSLRSLFRNGVMTIASIFVLVSCLIVMCSFAALVININHNLETLDMLNQIVVSIDPAHSESETLEIGERIKAYPNVDSIEYVSKAQALEEMRKTYSGDEATASLLDGYDEYTNPFPAEFVLTYGDAGGLETLLYQLNETDGVTDVTCYAEVASTIQNIKNTVSIVFIWFMAILLVVSVFVIINTIRIALYNRRQEITVMRYVGATGRFIVFPFLLEGTIIGIVSALLSYLIEFYLYNKVVEGLSGSLSILSFVPFRELSTLFFLGFLCVGVLTGIVGSLISIRKYLKA